MSRPRHIAILGQSAEHDPSAHLVAREIERRGHLVDAIDTAGLVSGGRLRLSPFGGDARCDGRLLHEADAIWVRTLDVHPPEGDPVDGQACVGQAVAALWSLVECSDAFVLDPPHILRGTPGTPRQLQLAKRVGLDVPDTLVTNDVYAAREFWSKHHGNVVGKLLESGLVGFDTDRGSSVIPTFALSPEDLEDPDQFGLCPLVLQERVAKEREVRLTVVGDRLFAAGIDVRGGPLDWRQHPDYVRQFRPVDVPEAVQASVLRLIRELRLGFATVDLLVTGDGRHVFLEANTVSHFAFVEIHAGLPIAAAVADLLLQEDR